MIKEVTRENVGAVIKEICDLVPKSAFISFDSELTGLCTSGASRYRQLDTAAERYTKLCDSAQSHGMWQFGLTLWQWNASKLHFVPNSYSIYLWPASVDSSSQGDYRRWSLQLSSVQFLVENGFDFNKALAKGCLYLSRQEEESFTGKKPRSESAAFADLKAEDQEFLAQMASLAREADLRVDLPSCNSYQRFLIYQHLPALLQPAEIQLSKIEGNAIRVSRAGDDTAARDLEERVGVRRIIDVILEHKIPMVGHNCWLDLMHFWQKFIGALPRAYPDFKNGVQNLIPFLIDTKYLANTLLSLESTSLSDLTAHFETASLPIKKARTKPHFHDAGYDSLCTGQVFIGFMRHLWPQSPDLNAQVAGMFTLHGNRLHMMQSDYPHVNLAGVDVEPDRSQVLVMADLDAACTTLHLQTALSGALQVPLAHLCIQWVDSQYAMVCLETSEQVLALLSKEILVLEKPLTLLSFAAYQERKARLPQKRPLKD